MTNEETKARLLGAGYQVLPIEGEPLWMVFWPPDRDGKRRAEAVGPDELTRLGKAVPVTDEEIRRPILDIRRIGVVGRFVQCPMSTDADGVPKVRVVLEVVGKNAVGSLPIDDIRDMLGQLCLLQINTVQVHFEVEHKRGA